MIKGKFIVPDYYPEFSCKGKECRQCCCDGWTITISQDEYFRLRSLPLSKDRKERRDAYVGILLHPTEERYARINLNFFGECPRRLENGYCGLQVQVGEENIPSVCRYYPRAPRLYPYKVSCLSNSCEWVLEKRRESDAPLSFQEEELTFYFNEKEVVKDVPKDYLPLHRKSLELLKDRSRTFNERLLSLGKMLHIDVSFFNDKIEEQILRSLCEKFKRSLSIGDYISSLPSSFLSRKEREESRRKKRNKFDLYREKFFSNHLLFTCFPYVDLIHRKDESFYGLYFIYDFYLLLLDGNLKDGEKTPFVDLSSCAFRVIEHSNRYSLIPALIHQENEE